MLDVGETPVARERVEHRLAAILAADVVGYSRLVEADEVGTLTAFRGYLTELVEPSIVHNYGRIAVQRNGGK